MPEVTNGFLPSKEEDKEHVPFQDLHPVFRKRIEKRLALEKDSTLPLSERMSQAKEMYKNWENQGINIQYNVDEIDKIKSLDEWVAEAAPDNMKKIAGFLVDYLASPLVTDSFNNHIERRVWKGAEEEKYGPVFTLLSSFNRLSGNTISSLFMSLQMLARMVDDASAKELINGLQKGDQAWYKNPEGSPTETSEYDSVPLEVKIAKTAEFREHVYMIFGSLKEKYPHPTKK